MRYEPALPPLRNEAMGNGHASFSALILASYNGLQIQFCVCL